VLECNGTTCQGSSYEFDKNGNMIYSAPSYNSSFSKYEYGNHHLLQEEKIWYQDNDFAYTKKYTYYKDSVVVKVVDFDNNLVANNLVPNPNYIHDIEYLDYKQISSQIKYDLFFPCGEEYLGENEIIFEYNNKDLIARVSIYNLAEKKTKSFDFSYSF
jgi:hypothetical protein